MPRRGHQDVGEGSGLCLIPRVLACIILGLLWTACAVSPAAKRMAAFSSATSVAANSAAVAFETVEHHYYQTQVTALVLNYDTRGFTPQTIKPLISDEDLKVRKEVMEGLQRYAERLAEITSDRKLQEFDSNTRAFGQSLVSLKGNPALRDFAARVPDQDLKVFTTAVDSLGRWFINYKRQKNIPRVIAEMQKPVEGICDLLIADIGERPDSNGEHGRGLRDQLWLQYDQMLRDQDTFLQKNKDKLDPRTKREEVAKLPELLMARQRADETLRETQEALRKLVETHNELGKAFEKESPKLDDLIRQLMVEGQQVKEFYESLEKK